MKPSIDVRLLQRRTIAALILVSGLLAACGTPTPGEERVRRARRSTGDIVIAAPWPWEKRKEIRFGEGLSMAADEINAQGGVLGRRLRVTHFDDQESVEEGRRLAQRIGADPDVVAVVGHLQSYVSVPAAAIYDLSGLLMISPAATDPELTAQGYKRVFRAAFTDRAIGRQVAELAAQRGYKRVAIEYVRNTYGRGLANAFEERAAELGIAIPGRQSYDPSEQANDRTFASTLAEWSDLEFDALFVAGEVPAGATFIAQARAQGITVPILGADAMSSPALIEVAGPAAEGTTVVSFFHPDEPRPEVKAFVEAFERRFGAPPDAGSALGYDAVHVLARAMKEAGSVVPDDVSAALRKGRKWPGVTGGFTFNEAGDRVDERLVTMQVRGHTFAYVPENAGAVAVAAAR
jgi:branched-chain amino acid transport system substrate-binding protein